MHFRFLFFFILILNSAFFLRILYEILFGFREKFQKRVTCVASSIDFAKTKFNKLENCRKFWNLWKLFTVILIHWCPYPKVAAQNVEARWVSVDGVGNLYLTDELTNVILKVDGEQSRAGRGKLSWKIRYRTLLWFFSQMIKLYRARSLLYRRQILQVNIRWKALDEIYKIYMLLHRSDLNISEMFRQKISHFLAKFCKFSFFF